MSKQHKRSTHKVAPAQIFVKNDNKNRLNGWYWLTMPLIILIYGLCYCEFGEVLALNYGAGWDGVAYTQFALAPKERLQTDAYRSQRILPALIVRSIAENAQRYSSSPKSYFGEWFQRWFFTSDVRFVKMVSDIRPRARQGDSTLVRLRLPLIEVVDKNDKHSVTVEPIITYWFVIYSLVIMVFCGVLWAAISSTLQLSVYARWLGFIGLFVNFAFLKMSLFYPTLTDLSAFCIGLLTLFGYLSRRNWLVLLAGSLGMVIWPTAFFIAAIFFLFPRSLNIPIQVPTSPSSEAFHQQPSFRVAAFGTFAAVLLAIWYVYIAPVRFPLVEQPHTWGAIVGICAFALSIFFALRPLAALLIEQGFLRSYIRFFRKQSIFLPFLTRILILCAVWVIGWLLRQSITNPNLPVPLNIAQFIGGSFSLAVTKPFLALVADVAYFGPVLLLVIFSYKRIISYIERLGAGFVIVFSVTVLLGCLMTESRQLINLFPVLVIACVLYAENIWLTRKKIIVAGFISLIFSKLWIPLNFSGMHEYVMQGGLYSLAPIQRYFMNHGPWMTWESYWLIAGGVLLCAVQMFLHLRFRNELNAVLMRPYS